MDFPLILLILVIVTGIVYILNKVIFLPGWMNEYIGSFFPVLLAVFILRSFIAEPFKIPSGSMLPTLYIGDFILVKKYSYGIRLPVINKKIINTNNPERGDVVVFRYPRDESVNFIKRLVGLPGDVIQYRDKRLIINGEVIEITQDGEFDGSVAGEPGLFAQQIKEKIGNVEHLILWDKNVNKSVIEFTVPEGQYFVMGDNRDHSNDSRYWGFVDDELLVGKAFYIWFYWDKCLKNWSNCSTNWSRMGDSII